MTTRYSTRRRVIRSVQLLFETPSGVETRHGLIFQELATGPVSSLVSYWGSAKFWIPHDLSNQSLTPTCCPLDNHLHLCSPSSKMTTIQYLSSTLNSTLEGLINPQTAVYGADLYKGVDPSQLNVFEQWWLQWYIYWGNPVIATGIMSFVLHEVSFLLIQARHVFQLTCFCPRVARLLWPRHPMGHH